MTHTNVRDLQKLIRIQYPGVVNNVEKAIETLGGIKAISQICSTSNRRLELRFRPKDFYCKPTCSTQIANYGLLLKVRVKKKKKEANPDESMIISTELVGFVDTSYKFDMFSDFQYLPLAPKDEESPETSGLKCIHDKAVPTGIPDVEWLNESCPYLLIPAVFSRVETPQTYNYRTSIIIREELEKKLLGKPRKKRPGNATVVCFNNVDPVPTEPKPAAMAAASTVPDGSVEIVKKLFDEHPIWSKNALMFVTNLAFPQLKLILPCLAYYFLTGPWRALWTRLGYDPRKIPQSRIYQTMDYRMRNIGGIKGFIKSRIHLSERVTNLKTQPKVKKQHGDYFGQVVEYHKETLSENCFVFRPDVLPPRRQIFFQYYNLKVPEIEEMLARLGDVLPGSLCHERRGWLPAGFDDQCRDILNNYVAERMRQIIAEESGNHASISGESDFNEYLMEQELEVEDGTEDLGDEVSSEDEDYDDIAE